MTVSLNSIADKDYHQYVINLIKKLFPTVTISIVKRNFNMVDIKINSKIVAEFMRGMGVVPNNKYVPDWIKTNKSFSNYCVRGLIDTEGSISFKHYKSRKRESVYKQLNFRNYNPLLMNFVHKHLTNLEIKPSVSPKKSLYISNPKSINLYLRIIGFSNPKLLRKVTL
ncbi:MAG TPA: hypothetical protein VHE53_03070 [Patescibacteria group bacterium]|nr:hypothetical protein [Patescibacteria group bacterium]